MATTSLSLCGRVFRPPPPRAALNETSHPAVRGSEDSDLQPVLSAQQNTAAFGVYDYISTNATCLQICTLEIYTHAHIKQAKSSWRSAEVAGRNLRLEYYRVEYRCSMS